MGKLSFFSQLVALLFMIYYAILSLPLFSLIDKWFYGVKQSSYQDVPDKNHFPYAKSKQIHSELYHEYLILPNSIRIHYASIGTPSLEDKPLMLFVHGFPECWYSWRYQMVEFWKDYFVVAIDMRGYNLSSRPAKRSDYRMDNLVEDIRAIICSLSPNNSAIIVSHDWGGAVAWSFAHKYPEMVKRLIIMNIPHPQRMMKALKSNEEQIKKSWYIFYFQLPFIPERKILQNGAAMIVDIFKKQMVNKDQMTDEDIAIFQEAVSRGEGNAIRAMVNYYRNVFTLGAFLSSRKMKRPLLVKTLMIWGEQDSALGKELTFNTEQIVPDIMIRYISNSSHWVQQDSPKEVNEIMREFLSDFQS